MSELELKLEEENTFASASAVNTYAYPLWLIAAAISGSDSLTIAGVGVASLEELSSVTSGELVLSATGVGVTSGEELSPLTETVFSGVAEPPKAGSSVVSKDGLGSLAGFALSSTTTGLGVWVTVSSLCKTFARPSASASEEYAQGTLLITIIIAITIINKDTFFEVLVVILCFILTPQKIDRLFLDCVCIRLRL